MKWFAHAFRDGFFMENLHFFAKSLYFVLMLSIFLNSVNTRNSFEILELIKKNNDQLSGKSRKIELFIVRRSFVKSKWKLYSAKSFMRFKKAKCNHA